MIQVDLICVRVPGQQPESLEHLTLIRPGTYINPARVDTVTPIDSEDQRRRDHLPPEVNAVIRYDDLRCGFRLMYVRNSAYDIARARRREILGEDSDTPDWGGATCA